MKNPQWSRRKLLSSLAIVFAAGSLHFRPKSGLSLFPQAHAASGTTLAGIGVALQAYGAFSKRDNGLGQMLGAMIALDKESIRLAREIIVTLAQVQKEIEGLKEEMRHALKEFGEDGIRIQTQTMVLNLDVVQGLLASQGTEILNDPGVQDRLRNNIQIATEVASTGSAEYGIGPVAAFCAPICMGAMAKSHTLLGDSVNFTRIEMNSIFIPWLEAILDPDKPGSVASLFASAGAQLKVVEASFPARVETKMRALLGDNAKAIAALPPGEAMYAHLQCHAYGLQTGTKDGKCLRWEPGPKPGGRESNGGDPVCVKSKQLPVYAPDAKLQRWLRVQNTSSLETGPQVQVNEIWGDPEFSEAGDTDELRWLRSRVAADANLEKCVTTALGNEKNREKQLAAIPSSKEGAAATAAVETLKKDSVQSLVDLRTITWTHLRILDETAETLKRVKGVFQL